MSFADLVTDYLTQPSPETFAALRAAVAAAPNYDPHVRPDAAARPLLEAEDYRGAVNALNALMPGAFLVPSAHGLLALAHDRLGEADAVERHATVAQAAVAGILNTGDGTAEKPWSVLTIAEEYDVLEILERKPTRTSLVEREGVSHDVMDFADGSRAWFALTWMGPRAEA